MPRHKPVTQAVQPDKFFDYHKVINQEQIKDKEPEIQEEKLVAALAKQDGWPILKQYINNLIDQMDYLNKNAMENGATFEVIGQNFVSSQLGKDLLRRILNYVEDAAG